MKKKFHCYVGSLKYSFYLYASEFGNIVSGLQI